MDHARSLDQSRASSQRFLPDRSQQGKELPFPARLYIRVNPHSQSDAVHPSADLPSAETAHHSEAANVANVRYIHAVEGKVFKSTQ
jgi:hypothetical protein